MWWIFSFYDFVLPALAIKQIVGSVHFDLFLMRFLMLGIIPGTDYQISLSDIIAAVWMIAFIVITIRLYFCAQQILLQLDPFRHIKSHAIYVNLISL